jgi:hypothetical protein
VLNAWEPFHGWVSAISWTATFVALAGFVGFSPKVWGGWENWLTSREHLVADAYLAYPWVLPVVMFLSWIIGLGTYKSYRAEELEKEQYRAQLQRGEEESQRRNQERERLEMRLLELEIQDREAPPENALS